MVLPLLALTWMSAVLAMTDKRSILFQILFAVFDSLQGFVIVMVHCILRREVRVETQVSPCCPDPGASAWLGSKPAAYRLPHIFVLTLPLPRLPPRLIPLILPDFRTSPCWVSPRPPRVVRQARQSGRT